MKPEYLCTCGLGHYYFNGVVLLSHPELYQHECDNCGRKSNFLKNRINYKNESKASSENDSKESNEDESKETNSAKLEIELEYIIRKTQELIILSQELGYKRGRSESKDELLRYESGHKIFMESLSSMRLFNRVMTVFVVLFIIKELWELFL